MSFDLGRHSRRELKGVHPDLVQVVERAIAITEQDFTVHDGIRSLAEQRVYYDTKVSQTLKSMHLAQEDGYGHAVDLVPYINRKLRWELASCIVIALAVRQASEELGVPVRWGGRLGTAGRGLTTSRAHGRGVRRQATAAGASPVRGRTPFRAVATLAAGVPHARPLASLATAVEIGLSGN